MKFKKLLCYLVIVMLFASCVMSKDIFNLNFDKDKGSEPQSGDFVKLINKEMLRGEIKDFKINVVAINRNIGFVIINDKKIDIEEVEIFQMDSLFYKRMPGTKKFVQRKKSGKINLYYTHQRSSGGAYNTNSSYDLHYLQKGNDGPIEKFSLKLLTDMASDNSDALSFIKQSKNKLPSEKGGFLDKAIDTYNGKR